MKQRSQLKVAFYAKCAHHHLLLAFQIGIASELSRNTLLGRFFTPWMFALQYGHHYYDGGDSGGNGLIFPGYQSPKWVASSLL